MNKQIFLNHIRGIEAELSRFGYLKSEEKVVCTPLYKDNLDVTYSNKFISRLIKLSFVEWNKGGYLLGMNMNITQDERTFFEVSWFLDKRNIGWKITNRLSAGGDFDAFVKKYFEDLTLLFNNELNDQITGKSFENHYDKLMASMNEY